MKRALRIFVAIYICLQSGPAARAAGRQLIAGHVPTATATSKVIGALAGDKQMDIVIGLPLRNRETLTNLLETLYDPASPNFRHYLSASQFAEQFGPTEADYAATLAFAQSNGLSVTRTFGNRTLVDVHGSVAAINKALHLTMMEYQHPSESRTFFAPDSEPSLDFGVTVLHIAGLDNYALPKPMLHPTPAGGSGGRPQSLNGTAPGGSYMGHDFRTAYAPGVTLDGTGQSVALLEFDGYYPADITAYESLASLPNVPLTNVLINSSGGVLTANGNDEVSLDIEMAVSMAPGLSKVMVYEGVRSHDILNQMAVDDAANQLSTSWTFTADSSLIQIYQQFITQGQSMFQASGDSDAYVGSPSFPTDLPYLTCVGGTTLTMTANAGAYSSETVWNWNTGTGASGGISTTYAIPSWQQGINMAASGGSTTFRNIPDVSMTADEVFVIAGNGQQFPSGFGGTSCATPLWAGFTALANQLATQYGMPPVGFINPAVYAIAKSSAFAKTFHDTTTGNNKSSSSPSKYSAAVGYDLCTGWGTPTGSNLLTAIALPEPLQVNPITTTPIAGPVGGPFGPSVSFTLSDSAVSALTWVVSNGAPWLTLSSTSGSLGAGGSVGVTATVNSGANSLAAGAYTSVLWFTNQTDHVGQSRTVTLLVASPPTILVQPTNVFALGGQTAVFSVQTGVSAQLAFQWWKNNGSSTIALTNSANITGATSNILSILSVTNSDVATYYVVVSNVSGTVTSSNATLSIVASAPIIALAPANLTLLPGQTATFTVGAVGSQPLTFQWKFNGTNLFSRSGIGGATSSTLIVSNITSAWAGAYTVVVNNTLGSNSSSAVLTVTSVGPAGSLLATIYSFPGGTAGQYPYAGLMTNSSVPTTFYGVTLQGGANGFGAAFRMGTTGLVTPLLSFADGSTSISEPYAGMILGKDTFYYGVSASGGSAEDGTVYRFSGSQLTVIKSFTGLNGDLPVAPLMQGPDLALYGTTLLGGLFDQGSVFRVTTSGTFTNLASFDGLNGGDPSGALIEDAFTNIYGTTEIGGFYGLGTVFQITPNGQLRNLVSFDGSNGNGPIAGLTADGLGDMYGETQIGGAFDEGEIFELFPDGTGSVIYDFSGLGDGVEPFGGMTLGTDGNIYGTTEYGGDYDDGTIFEISPDGTFTTLASFDGYQGANPAGNLIQYQGSWYGTTVYGGALNLGTIFHFTVSGPLQITGQPQDELLDLGGSGVLSVATLGGTPVTYQWRKNGTNLVDGSGITGSTARLLKITGAAPTSAGVYSVVVNNSFGSVTSSPALVQVLISTPVITTQPFDETVLSGSTALLTVQAIGDFPLAYQWLQNGVPISDNGRITGTTNATLTIRQATAADSGVYSVLVYDDLYYSQSSNATLLVTPLVGVGSTFTTVYSFTGVKDGANPYASLVQGRDGLLYGTAVAAGAAGDGTIFTVSTNGTFTFAYAFPGTSLGANPFAGLVQGVAPDNGFYGAAQVGGAHSFGSVYRLAPNKSGSSLHAFDGSPDGNGPDGTLAYGADGRLYGTTATGGDYDEGAVFVTTTNGSLSILYSFTGLDDGSEPVSGLTLASNGMLYGTTYQGGVNGYGAIYQIDTSGNFTSLFSFSGYDGAYPASSLTQGPDGRMYGTTFVGGFNNYGVVFALNADNSVTNLFSFDYDDGAAINAGLAVTPDGAFIGAAQNGGPGGAGGIFKITTNGVWTPLIWFNGANGSAPQNAPTLATDGYYYGLTYFGGVSNVGTIYRLSIPAAPRITTQPADVLAVLGTNVSFSVTAASSTALTYQWFFNNAPILNATNATLSIVGVTNGNAGSYYVALTNAAGSALSRVAVLSLGAPPILGNGGFETGDFTGWTLSGNSSAFTVTTDGAAHGGTYGASLSAPSTLGYLAETPATSPGSMYQVSFWLNTASASGANEVTVLWNGAVAWDQLNITTTGWTNCQVIVAATNTTSALSIGVRDDGGFIALDDVSLLPVPTLQTTTISNQVGGSSQVTFNWSASAGREYQVQYKATLNGTNWINLGDPISPSSGAVSLTDYLTNSQRYYRIVLLQ